MRRSLAAGAAVLSGLLAVNSNLSAQQNLEIKVNSAQVQDSQFTSLKRKIEALEADFYKRNPDASQIGNPAVDMEDTSKKIARVAYEDIKKYLEKIGLTANYTVTAAFTYRDEVVLKAQDNKVDLRNLYIRDGYIRLSGSKASLSDFARFRSLEYRVFFDDPGIRPFNLEAEPGSSLPSFDEMKQTLQYINTERPKFTGMHAYSTKPMYMDFMLRDLMLKIQDNCGIDSDFYPDPPEFSMPGRDSIRLNFRKPLHIAGTKDWHDFGIITLGRNRAEVSLAGERGYEVRQLPCRP